MSVASVGTASFYNASCWIELDESTVVARGFVSTPANQTNHSLALVGTAAVTAGVRRFDVICSRGSVGQTMVRGGGPTLLYVPSSHEVPGP